MYEQKFVRYSSQVIQYFIFTSKFIDMKLFKLMSAVLLVNVIMASCGNDSDSKGEVTVSDTAELAGQSRAVTHWNRNGGKRTG